MNVRPATVGDVMRLTQLAQLEHAQSRFKDRPFDRSYAARNFEQCINGLASRVFVSEAELGFIAGIAQPKLFCKFHTAYELAWYAEDGSGFSLLKAFTEWARKMRCLDLVVSNYAGIKDNEKFTRVMRRAGFEMLGSSYTKPLT